MSYNFKGSIKTIKDTQVITDSFSKREFVILDESGQYPQTILFQAVQDKCDMLNNFKQGDLVEVFFNLRGREWTNPQGEVKVFNTLDAWKVSKLDATRTNEGSIKEETFVAGGDDDLPF